MRHSPRSLALFCTTLVPFFATTAQGEDNVDEVVVTGTRFNYETVESANKVPLSVKDTPQSVKVITEDVIEFAGIRELEDTYKIDAGSHVSHLDDGFARNYFRGFLVDSDNAFKIDGMRAFGVIDLDLSAMERIEIIKGSTSTMYGHSPIGGMTNAISKKPTPEFGGSVDLEAGTYNRFRGAFDIHGALTSDDKLSGRLVASYLDEEGAVDYFYRKNTVVAPSLKYEFTENTAVTLITQYQKQDFMPLGNFGVRVANINPITGAYPRSASSYSVPDVARDTLVGQTDQFFESELKYARLLLEHSFGGSWKLRANAQYAKLDNLYFQSQGVTTHAESGETDLEIFGGDNESEIKSAEINLYGDIEIGGRNHTLFLGADVYDTETEGASPYAWLGTNTGFSIYSPDYSVLPRTQRSLRDYTSNNPALAATDYVEVYGALNGYREVGLTAQTFLRPVDGLIITLGARYAEFEDFRVGTCCDLDAYDAGYGPKDYFRNYATTYQAGVTYAVTERLNAYASYGTTFTPRNEFAYDPSDPSGDGTKIGPEEGEAYEIGLKGDAADQRFSWSVALFQIARTNISQNNPDPALASRGFRVKIGEQQARGIELDFQGEIVDGWSVFVSAAVLDNEFKEGEFKGYPAWFAPKWGLSTFTSYQIQDGPLTGLGFGGGMVYKKVVDPKPFFGGARGVTLELFDDVFEVDARAFYERGPWNYSLAVTNVLDDKYYSPSYGSPFYAINVNPGRQLVGAVKYKF